jgi:predicted DsbA family dithiol-disulfide isomerase
VGATGRSVNTHQADPLTVAHHLGIGHSTDAVTSDLDVIEVFADIWCPFTHVGLRRLVAERERRRSAVIFRVRAWPLELVNREPLASDFVGEEIAALRRVVARDLFAGFDPERFPSTTLPALGLAAQGYRRGDHLGEQLSLELRTELFENGRNIEDPAVLDAVGHRFGLNSVDAEDEEAIRKDLTDGQARGVVGSPHFFVGAHSFFCPSLKVARTNDQLDVTFDHHSFASFVETCFR